MDSKLFEWDYKLFFSVDLIGSTAYKAEQFTKELGFNWAPAFENFYRDFPLQFNQKCINKKIQQPVTWKFLGDEILFYASISTIQFLFELVISFADTIREYNDVALKDCKMLCKGTIWSAGFPVGNIPYEYNHFGINGDPVTILDFIGPQIDAGFRITKFSTDDRLTISVETAYLLSYYKSKEHLKDDYLPIKFLGNEVLKGVLNNTAYPIFYIELIQTRPEHKWVTICDSKEVYEYCEKFIESSQFLRRPFIYTEIDPHFNVVPDGMEAIREEIKQLRADDKSLEPESLFVVSEYDENSEQLYNILKTELIKSEEQNE